MQNEQETLSLRGGQANRLTYIDIAKGVGIFLVVVGHCIPDATSATGISIPAYRWLHDVIYSFHMPLFFFLAGFMVSRQKMLDRAQKPLDLVRKRVSRLLVPYIFVGLCYAPFKLLLSNFANKPYDISTIWQIVIGVNPDGELWFLYALFVITVIAALFAFRISLLGLVAAAALLIWNPWGIITNFLFFFLLGIYMRREHKDFVLHLTARHILAAVAVFLLGLYGLLGLKEHACFLLTATSGTVLVPVELPRPEPPGVSPLAPQQPIGALGHLVDGYLHPQRYHQDSLTRRPVEQVASLYAQLCSVHSTSNCPFRLAQ